MNETKILGQVLKIRKARMMCTKDGLEVRGFNHLRGVYANENTFLISAFRNKVTYEGSDLEDNDGIAPTRYRFFRLRLRQRSF